MTTFTWSFRIAETDRSWCCKANNLWSEKSSDFPWAMSHHFSGSTFETIELLPRLRGAGSFSAQVPAPHWPWQSLSMEGPGNKGPPREAWPWWLPSMWHPALLSTDRCQIPRGLWGLQPSGIDPFLSNKLTGNMRYFNVCLLISPTLGPKASIPTCALDAIRTNYLTM